MFDFKCVTPRVDMRSKDRPSVSIKHNVVMVDPYHTKQLLQLLTRVLADYEKEFGKITKPKAVAKMEAKMKKKTPVGDKTIKAPTYFG